HLRGRRSTVLAEARLRRLRLEHAGDDTARLFVQLAARRVPGMPGAGNDDRLRPAADRARREQVARRRRDCSVGARRQETGARRAAGALARLRDRSECAVLASAQEIARDSAVRIRKAVRGTGPESPPPIRRGQLVGAGRAGTVPIAAAVSDVWRSAAEAAE